MSAPAGPGTRVAVLLVLSLLFGCATAPSASPVAAQPETKTDIRIEQLPASDLVIEQRGAISIAYQMTVRNPTTQPIRLTALDMKAVGRSPYTLREEQVAFNETIEPGKEAVIAFSMWAYPKAKGGTHAEKVWVQGKATFEGAAGTFQRAFSQTFTEPR